MCQKLILDEAHPEGNMKLYLLMEFYQVLAIATSIARLLGLFRRTKRPDAAKVP